MRAIILFALILLTQAFSPDAQEAESITSNTKAFNVIISPETQPELVLDGTTSEPGLTFTEGPSWLNGKLYFSNYYMFWKKWKSSDEGGLIEVSLDGTHRVLNRDVQTCGTIPLSNGNLAVCDLINCSVVEMTPDGRVIRTLARSYEGKRFGRPNDIVTDAKGGIYFTDPNNSPKWKEKMTGNAIYYIAPDGDLTRLTDWDEYGFPNGIVLSPDGHTFYVNDTQSFIISAYDVADDGSLSNKREFAMLKEFTDAKGEKVVSYADGMTIDTLGNIYVAVPQGIEIFDNAGTFIGVIAFPKGPSNCIFGGDDMKTLYATCRDQIYRIRTKVVGVGY